MPVFGLAARDVDTVAPLVAALVVFVGLASELPVRDAGLDTLVLQGCTIPVGVRTMILQQLFGLGHVARECCRAVAVADVPDCHEKFDRAVIRVRDGMQLGAHARPLSLRTGCRARLFQPRARSHAVCLEIGGVDHHGLPVGGLRSKPLDNPGEDTHVIPALLTVVEVLR